MSTLNSSSTNAQVWDAYDDNASYEEDGNQAKARAFITACRLILRRRPASTGRGEMTVNFESIKSEMDDARSWLVRNPGQSSNGRQSERFGDLRNFRE